MRRHLLWAPNPNESCWGKGGALFPGSMGRRTVRAQPLQGIPSLHPPQESHPPFMTPIPPWPEPSTLLPAPWALFSLIRKGCSQVVRPFLSQQRGETLAGGNQWQYYQRARAKQRRASAHSPPSCAQALTAADWEHTLVPLSSSAFPIKIGVSNRTSFP